MSKQYLSHFKLYWKVKAMSHSLLSTVIRFKYHITNYLRSIVELFNTLSHLSQSVLGYFFIPLLIAFSLQYFQPEAQVLLSKMGGKPLDYSEYGTLLAAITSICGIFIGLYYAAITSISGAIYARVPQNIRSLLLRERMGNAYMHFLAMFTILGIVLLALYIMGGKPNPITPALIVIFSGIAVYSFIHLGMRAFTLFDPTSLAVDVVIQLKKSLVNVVAGANYWELPSFQNHERIKAKSYIDTLEVLAEIALKESHLSGQVLVDFCQKIIWFLRWNEIEKSKIPSESHWFESKYKHPNWYQTSDTETSMVHQTGSSLSPKVVRYHDWVESRLLCVIYNGLKLNLREQRFSIAHDLYELLEKYIRTCAKNGRVTYAFDVIKSISKITEDEVVSLLLNSNNKQSLELISICDGIAKLPISVFLEYSRSIELKNKDLDDIAFSDEFDWNVKKNIYHFGFAPKTIEHLELLQKSISFELEVEKKLVTKSWYINNIVFRSEAEVFIDCVKVIYEESLQLYTDWSKKLLFSNRYWLAACCVTREKEFIFKLGSNLKIFESYWESTVKYKKHDADWPIFDLDLLNQLQKKRVNDIDIISGKISTALIMEEKPDDYPDFAGQFLHSLSEAVFDSAIENNIAKLLTLLPQYFFNTFTQAKKLMPSNIMVDFKQEHLTKIALSPIFDVMDLSGYCILMSEYYNNHKMRMIVDVFWDNYFGVASNIDSNNVDLISTILGMYDFPYEVPHRNQHRFRWGRIVSDKFFHEINSRPVTEVGSYFSVNLQLHSSALVRIFAGDEGRMRYSGVDVFYTYILKIRLSDERLGLLKRRDLEDEVNNEIEFYEKNKERGVNVE